MDIVTTETNRQEAFHEIQPRDQIYLHVSRIVLPGGGVPKGEF